MEHPRRLPGRWGRVGRPGLAWGLGAGSLLLMAVGLGLLALSRHARFPPSMDTWDEQALVILEFLGAPILGGLIAARRPGNPYGWLWCVIGVGVGLDAFARGYATYGLLGRPGVLPGAMAAAWATNVTWVLGLGLVPLVLLLFPDGRLPTRRWRPLAWLVLVLAVALPLEARSAPGRCSCSASSTTRSASPAGCRAGWSRPSARSASRCSWPPCPPPPWPWPCGSAAPAASSASSSSGSPPPG
jgi:hypothetical protein